MNKQAIIQELDSLSMKPSVPKIKAGYTVQVTQKIKEGEKERLQVFEGIVIKTHLRGGLNSTITVRKISEGIGVEKVFPLHSPSVVEIKIVKIAKVSRAKLYYLRDRAGKSARLPEFQITQAQRDELVIHFKKAEKASGITETVSEPIETTESNDTQA